MNRTIGLDIVRAFAICLVLLCHFARERFDFIGIYGVELFFALSGFLIGGILYRRLTACDRWSFDEVKVFWLRRWWRTLPNYFLFLVLSIVFHHYSGGLPHFLGVLPYFFFAQNLVTVNTGFFPVSWSLCVEEYFYLFFPLCILLFTSLRFSRRIAFIFATLLFLVIPPILREILFATVDPTFIRLMTIPRLDAIFYGVVTSFLLARHRISQSHRVALLIVASVGLAVLFVLQRHCEQNHSLVPFYRAAFLGLPIFFSLLLPFFASIQQLPGKYRLLTRVITNLSLWSYSIYLSHLPIMFITYSAFGDAKKYAVVKLISKFIGLAVCLVVSRFVYRRFESRLILLRPDEPHQQKQVAQS